MSESVDTLETQGLTDATPGDDATIVNDDPGDAKAEENHRELVRDVEKLLDKGEAKGRKGGRGEGDEEHETPAEGREAQGEGAMSKEEAGKLSQDLLSRADAAGFGKELAERLHQGGLLEESLAAFDRKLIEQGKPGDDPKAPPGQPDPPPRTPPREGQDDDQIPPPLSEEVYEEPLVRRDAFFQKRIGELEARIEQMTQSRAGPTSEWFTERVGRLGNKQLFGNGDVTEGSEQANNRAKLREGYEQLCRANGLDPAGRHSDLLDRAYPAMFPNEVFKQAQRETVDRLRDAQGRFLSSPRSSSQGPPARYSQMTEDERHADLVAEVDAYLKKSSA